MLQFRTHHDFNNRSVNELLALYTQRDYFLEKYRRLGATDMALVACEDDGERFHIDISRRVPQTTPFPDFLLKIIGETVLLEQSDTWWRSEQKGRLNIRLGGMPVTVVIDMRLEQLGAACRHHLDASVQAKVPLVGAKIEAFLGQDIRARMREDMAMNEQLLDVF